MAHFKFPSPGGLRLVELTPRRGGERGGGKVRDFHPHLNPPPSPALCAGIFDKGEETYFQPLMMPRPEGRGDLLNPEFLL